MKDIANIEFRSGSKEERLPGFAPDFPYIASRAELDKYIGRFVPWHWHKTVELFYLIMRTPILRSSAAATRRCASPLQRRSPSPGAWCRPSWRCRILIMPSRRAWAACSRWRAA